MPFGGPRQVLKYLARYTHRVAISNHRLLAMSDGQVTFLWKDYANANATREMTLDTTEFTRRFLLHSLPRGPLSASDITAGWRTVLVVSNWNVAERCWGHSPTTQLGLKPPAKTALRSHNVDELPRLDHLGLLPELREMPGILRDEIISTRSIPAFHKLVVVRVLRLPEAPDRALPSATCSG